MVDMIVTTNSLFLHTTYITRKLGMYHDEHACVESLPIDEQI
jgi:hypothetical protein